MCGKETEEQRLAREAQEGMGSTKEHFGKRTCWALLFIILCLMQALCAFPLYIAFVVDYGYLVATVLAVALGVIVAILYWEQCCHIQSKIADVLFWIFVLAELVLIGYTCYALYLVVQNYITFTSDNGCYKLLSNPQYSALVTYGCDSLKNLLIGCIIGCVVAIVIAALLVWILTRLRRHRKLANKHKAMEEGKLGADGKPVDVAMQSLDAAGQPISGQPVVAGQPVTLQAAVPSQTVMPQTVMPQAVMGDAVGAPQAAQIYAAPQAAPAQVYAAPPQTIVPVAETVAMPPPQTIVVPPPETVIAPAQVYAAPPPQ